MNPITQQEIDTLPPPPQEWLDEIYGKQLKLSDKQINENKTIMAQIKYIKKNLKSTWGRKDLDNICQAILDNYEDHIDEYENDSCGIPNLYWGQSVKKSKKNDDHFIEFMPHKKVNKNIKEIIISSMESCLWKCGEHTYGSGPFIFTKTEIYRTVGVVQNGEGTWLEDFNSFLNDLSDEDINFWENL